MKKRILSFLLATVVFTGCLSLGAFAQEPDDSAEESSAVAISLDDPMDDIDEPSDDSEEDTSLMYVALGDSIAAGVGLEDFVYWPADIGLDLTPNFKGYSEDCYVAVVADGLGLDRDHAINLALPGLMTKDMVDMVKYSAMPEMNGPSGAYYVYPEYQEYLREADIISIQIGSNDTVVPFVVSLGEATNWKSETLANSLVSGLFRDFSFSTLSSFISAVGEMTLTKEERQAFRYALGDGMKQICADGYQETVTYLPQVIDAIRELNPDAQILLIGFNNPIPVSATWIDTFGDLNRYAEQLAEEKGVTFVPIPNTKNANDGHPTIRGHKYIGRQILNAIQ